MCVPLRSPRDTNGAPALLILRNASSVSSPPAIPAGSDFGPMMTKSLYMTGKRCTPWPSRRNCSSADFACTNTTSASPRRARSSAWPVPSATTRTSMPVFCSKIGRMCLKSPDCSVEVVDATVMNRCASALGAQREREEQASDSDEARASQLHGSSPLMKAAASAVDGCAKKRSTGA